MNIKEFIELFNNAKDKNIFIREHIKDFYIPYERKMALCKNVIEGADYTPNLEVIDKKYYSPNTPMRFVFFCMSIIKTYTDITCEKIMIDNNENDDILGGFNQLDKYGVFEILFQELGKEYKELQTVLSMMIEDINNKENSLVGFLSTKLDAFEILLNTALPIIEDNIVNFPKKED